MSNTNSKQYKIVKNFIHNEEKITKEEIRGMIREAVNLEVRRIVEEKKTYIDEVITSYVRGLVERGLSDSGHLYYGFKERVAQELSSEVAKFISNIARIPLPLYGGDELLYILLT